jgi:hypothetical protein
LFTAHCAQSPLNIALSARQDLDLKNAKNGFKKHTQTYIHKFTKARNRLRLKSRKRNQLISKNLQK